MARWRLGVVCACMGLVSGCERVCRQRDLILLDAVTWEAIPHAQVSIAVTNDIGEFTALEYIESFGEPNGETNEFGQTSITVCGYCRIRSFVEQVFDLDNSLVVVGLTRAPGSPLEVVLVEFAEGRCGPAGPSIPIRSAVGETIDVSSFWIP